MFTNRPQIDENQYRSSMRFEKKEGVTFYGRGECVVGCASIDPETAGVGNLGKSSHALKGLAPRKARFFAAQWPRDELTTDEPKTPRTNRSTSWVIFFSCSPHPLSFTPFQLYFAFA